MQFYHFPQLLSIKLYFLNFLNLPVNRQVMAVGGGKCRSLAFEIQADTPLIAYSLGVITAPDGSGQLLLRVEGEQTDQFARSVQIEGETVPVVVRGGFRQPKAL